MGDRQKKEGFYMEMLLYELVRYSWVSCPSQKQIEHSYAKPGISTYYFQWKLLFCLAVDNHLKEFFSSPFFIAFFGH